MRHSEQCGRSLEPRLAVMLDSKSCSPNDGKFDDDCEAHMNIPVFAARFCSPIAFSS